MNEKMFGEILQGVIENHFEGGCESLGYEAVEVRSVRTFEDVMMLTCDEGLIIRLANGAELALTIQLTREAEEAE